MEYIFVCPKCGASYGKKDKAGKICSDCGIETVYSGYSDNNWYAMKREDRLRLSSEIKAGNRPKIDHVESNVRQEQADANVYCRYCGQKILREALICPHCGCKTDKPDEDDVPSIGLNLLSFFFPVIGLILFCVFYTRTPKKANGVGKAALISVGIQFALGLILGISGVSMLSFLG